LEAAQKLLGHLSPETTKIYLDSKALLKKQIEETREIGRKTMKNH
jgi:hypothetical protein